MKPVQSLWTGFELAYSNHPIPFEDELFGDGLSTKYQVTFYPIYDLENLLPVVTLNTGTLENPIWTVLTEGTDYTLNYQNGELIFQGTSIPKELLDLDGERVATAKINAYHCKINLDQNALPSRDSEKKFTIGKYTIPKDGYSDSLRVLISSWRT